jgi:hypothetical protein
VPTRRLPEDVSFRQSYPNATIKAATKETENGKTVWEVESNEKKEAPKKK